MWLPNKQWFKVKAEPNETPIFKICESRQNDKRGEWQTWTHILRYQHNTTLYYHLYPVSKHCKEGSVSSAAIRSFAYYPRSKFWASCRSARKLVKLFIETGYSYECLYCDSSAIGCDLTLPFVASIYNRNWPNLSPSWVIIALRKTKAHIKLEFDSVNKNQDSKRATKNKKGKVV